MISLQRSFRKILETNNTLYLRITRRFDVIGVLFRFVESWSRLREAGITDRDSRVFIIRPTDATFLITLNFFSGDVGWVIGGRWRGT